MKTNKLAQTAALALAGLFAAQLALADPIYGSINTLTTMARTLAIFLQFPFPITQPR